MKNVMRDPAMATDLLHRRMVLKGAFCTSLFAATGSYAFAATADDLWEDYKQRFMTPDGRIIDAHEGVASHSEGQGYGMLFSVAFNDQSSFDRLWNWTATALRRPQDALFSWRYLNNSVPHVPDHNNATDGDLLIALALTRAAKKWQRPHLLMQAKQIYSSIRKKLLVNFNGRLVLLPGLSGFLSPGKATLNMSYYVIPSMRAAQELDDAGIWTKAIDDGVALIRQARFGRWGLPPDWLTLGKDRDIPEIATGWPPRFSYDAIRVPLYLQWGGMLDLELASPFVNYWHAYASGILPAWIDLKTDETAPYGAPEGFHAIGAVCGFENGFSPTLSRSADYYSSSLVLLSNIVARHSEN